MSFHTQLNIIYKYNAYRKTLRGAGVGWGRVRFDMFPVNSSELKHKKKIVDMSPTIVMKTEI
jgi:hypothetical protein